MHLRKFEISHNFLDKMGIPRLEKYENNVEIERIDLTEQEQQGNIEWRINGIYLNILGQYHRGFMYLKYPNIKKYGYPKFHLLECEKIKEQKRRGYFHNRYFWSNSPTVTLTDRVTHKTINNVVLNLCNYCKSDLEGRTGESIDNTSYFRELIDSEMKESLIINNKGKDRDIFNRPLNWRVIARDYKEKKNYTCEICGFGGKKLKSNFDKRFIHVHHIHPSELMNTHIDNLKSVCILCHYYQDSYHQNNFEKKRMKSELFSFVRRYKNELIEINNPYIKSFLIKFGDSL